MIRTEAYTQPATSYQFLPENIESLRALTLPTGVVTVQAGDELNRVEGRCYVPTSWGTSILSEGDWIVVYDVGVVSTFTNAQHFLLFRQLDDMLFEVEAPVVEEEVVPMARMSRQTFVAALDTELSKEAAQERTVESAPIPETLPVIKFRVTEDSSSWMPSFQAYCERYRLDYSINVENVPGDREHLYEIKVNATGRRVIIFGVDDVLAGYSDGRMEHLSRD